MDGWNKSNKAIKHEGGEQRSMLKYGKSKVKKRNKEKGKFVALVCISLLGSCFPVKIRPIVLVKVFSSAAHTHTHKKYTSTLAKVV